MKKIDPEIVDFLHAQGCVLVSTIDENGFPHNSCKGVVKIDPRGEVYLLDVYHGQTQANIRSRIKVSISAFDEHKFLGYCLKGKARILSEEKLIPELVKAWEDRLTTRLTQRLLKNLREEKVQVSHPEAKLPAPKYLIIVEIEEIVDLSPEHLK